MFTNTEQRPAGLGILGRLHFGHFTSPQDVERVTPGGGGGGGPPGERGGQQEECGRSLRSVNFAFPCYDYSVVVDHSNWHPESHSVKCDSTNTFLCVMSGDKKHFFYVG